MGHTPQITVHNTINYFTCDETECQGNLFKSLCMRGLFLLTLTKSDRFQSLTKKKSRDKMSWRIRQNAPPRIPRRVKTEGNNCQLSILNCQFIFADVVELVDSLDLGSNARACRFESCHPHQNKKHPSGCLLFWYA